jgi:transcriptional regulator with XRE-family HTH domain
MTCPRCGGTEGAHFAFCFAAQLFERLMGPGYPLFPPLTPQREEQPLDVDLLQRNLDEAYRQVREAEGIRAERDAALAELARVREQGADEHVSPLWERATPARDDDYTEAGLAATEQDEANQAAVVEALGFTGEPAPERRRATVVGYGDFGDGVGRLLYADTGEAVQPGDPEYRELTAEEEAPARPHRTIGEAMPDPAPRRRASVLERPEVRDHIDQLVAEAPPLSTEQKDHLRALLGGTELGEAIVARHQPEPEPESEAEPEAEAEAEPEAQPEPEPVAEAESEPEPETPPVDEAAARIAWMDEHRVALRQLINAHPGVLSQLKLAQAIGVNSGTVSFILNGKAYGPTSRNHLQRMLEVADNMVAAAAPKPASPPTPAAVSGDQAAAIEMFLNDRVEQVLGSWESAENVRAAYEEWRQAIEAPPVADVTLGTLVVSRGFTRERRTVAGRQLRGYGGLRLREVGGGTPAGSGEGGGASDEEGDVTRPATPTREPLHPDAQRYERDRIGEALAAVDANVVTQFIAGEAVHGLGPVLEPSSLLPGNIFDAPVDQPPGWDDLPGKELAHREIRAMAATLVKEQGWGYKRPRGRGKPKLRSPSGQPYVLPSTPGDYRSVKNARAELRRLGAVL